MRYSQVEPREWTRLACEACGRQLYVKVEAPPADVEARVKCPCAGPPLSAEQLGDGHVRMVPVQTADDRALRRPPPTETVLRRQA